MAEMSRTRGFRLRPHAKTHKTAELAQLQLQGGACGLSVATIGEAEFFSQAGCADIFIAYPLWANEHLGERLRHLADSIQLSVGVDSIEGAQQLAKAMGSSADSIGVLIEIDSGHHRTGVDPVQAGVVAHGVDAAGLAIRGVFTFPGHGYVSNARERAAQDEAQSLQVAAGALDEIGLSVEVFSGGSTPTTAFTQQGMVNEIRPGPYVFNDANQVSLGVCDLEDVALVAAATVVSAPEPNRFVLNLGSKILGADCPSTVVGYGILLGYPQATITSLSEHHAVVHVPRGESVPKLGSLVAVVPNHVCNSVNLADELLVVQEGSSIARWYVAARSVNSY
jgi:D-serine deaminase-like pyridoxal phosphate-dependent protein